MIPQVQMADEGEYSCHVFNDYDSNEKSLFLTIQGNQKLITFVFNL